MYKNKPRENYFPPNFQWIISQKQRHEPIICFALFSSVIYMLSIYNCLIKILLFWNILDCPILLLLYIIVCVVGTFLLFYMGLFGLFFSESYKKISCYYIQMFNLICSHVWMWRREWTQTFSNKLFLREKR